MLDDLGHSLEEGLPIGKRIKEHRRQRNLTQEQLARESDVPYTTLIKIESGAIKNPSLQAVARIAKALDASLDDFLMVEQHRGKSSILRVFSDVLETLEPGEEMHISGIDESRYLKASKKGTTQFIRQLAAKNITQKLLSCEGDYTRLKGEHLEYRWIPEKFFNPTPIYVYGDKVASIIWGPPQQVVILRNPFLADAYRKQFLFMWEHATRFPDD